MYVEGKPIMSYDHPFHQTIINDNSAIPDFETAVPERVNFLSVFTCGKGRDNKLIKMKTRSQFITEYGQPDTLKYGQPVLNAYTAIVDQFSHSYCMRVMPTDACYSNIIILLKYKNDENNTCVMTKLEAQNIGGLNDRNQFESIFATFYTEEVDAEGFKTVPLMAIVSMGRGLYGNSYRVRLTNLFHRNRNQKYRRYNLELIDVDLGNKVVESFSGTLYDHSINGVSYLMSDVVDGEYNGSDRIDVFVNELAFEEVYEAYKLAAPEEERIDFKMFDPIFGVHNDKTKQDYIQSLDEGIFIDRLDGVPMTGGNDGMLDNPPEGKTREDVIHDLYVAAFYGELDKAILSCRRTPVKFMLDANFPLEVKQAMVQLALKRYDAMVHLDAGFLYTIDDALTFGEETTDMNYRIVSKSFQHFEIRDPFNGKRLPVTVTYDLARNLARHIELYGIETPYTGEKYATLKGYIKGTLYPVVDEYDEDLKEEIYDLRLNYYEAVAEEVHARATQQTAQDLESDLSEENNMLMVLEIKDVAEKETVAKRYNFAEPEDRALFGEILNERIKYMKEKVRKVEVYYDMTPEEEAKQIIHCYIEVIFKTMAKSSIVEINVNRRV